MSSILDTITGGGILPHVYCRKVTLERNSEDSSLTDVILSLELYQEKNSLLKSSWLNDIDGGGMNFLDALCIQVVPYKKTKNVKKLLPSNEPTGQLPDSGNVYVAKQQYGDGYLPRGEVKPYSSYTSAAEGNMFENKVFSLETEAVYKSLPDVLFPKQPPSPMQISNSSILGGLADMDKLSKTKSEGKIREENIDGKIYYVLPFEHRETGFDEKNSAENSLGFLFFTFLHVPLWIRNGFGAEIYQSFDKSFFEEFVVEGPVNTEVVFMDGKLRKTREAFFLPDGEPWEGSVHLHTSENKAPSGYFGDGGFSGAPEINEKLLKGTELGEITNFGDDYRGWMVGETHHSSGLPKLRLLEIENDKIVDFRNSLFAEPQDANFGMGIPQEVFNLTSEVKMLEEHFLSPFQKEKRKDFLKDNDSEYSKLYICRDSQNNARGIFFINFLELLKNNSTLFPLMFGKNNNWAQNILDVMEILQNSKILQLKVFRDRVKEKTIGGHYENFANDEPYEEPSKLIGIIGDSAGFKTPTQTATLSEIDGIASGTATQNQAWMTTFTTRYFMFSDKEISKQNAGLYRYRIELDFKDGTYEFLYKLYQRLNRSKIVLDQYYDLSTSTFTKKQQAGFKFNRSLIPDQYSKAIFKNYYKGGFVPEFKEKVDELTTAPDSATPSPWPFKPWNSTLTALQTVQNIFGIFPKINTWSHENNEWIQEKVNFKDAVYKNMIDPVKGSPKGIGFFSRLLGASIKKVESLLGGTKVNKTGSEVAASAVPDGYSFNQMLDVVVSAGDFTIKEHYSFDSANELFEAVDNTNVYVDYLSVGQPMTTGFMGIKPLRTEYFKERCRLEAAKFSPLAQTQAGFNGMAPDSDIGLYSSPIPNAPDPNWKIYGGQEDRFSLTGYSYLAPSMVRISSGLSKGKNYNFRYNVFKINASDYLDSSVSNIKKLFNASFLDAINHEKVFVALKNYSLNKEETRFADLPDGFAGVEGEKIPGIQPSVLMHSAAELIVSHREPWKKIMEKMGITMHDPQTYNIFFDKEPGAVHKTAPASFPLKLKDFSDGIIMPSEFIKDMVYRKNQPIVKLTLNEPSPVTYGASYNNAGPLFAGGVELWPYTVPNSFKIWAIEQNRNATINTSVIHPELKPFFDDPLSKAYNIFFYFNVNLTARIEVFRGIPSNNVSKNDESAWSLLTEGDLDLADEEKLFCRLIIEDERLQKGMKVPTIDKYFLIYNNATLHVPFVMPFPNESVILGMQEMASGGTTTNVELNVGVPFTNIASSQTVSEAANTSVQTVTGPNITSGY